MKNYKKITTKKIKIIKVDNYDELINKLKFNNISPQEAYDLVIKNKFQTNRRYYWTLEKISYYLYSRFTELYKFAIKNGKWLSKKDAGDVNKKITKMNSLKFDKEIIKAAKEGKIFSKRVDSCRNAVNGNRTKNVPIFETNFIIYFPFKKFDARKEVQTLQKLVSEKKHSPKFIKKNWKPYSSTSDKLLQTMWVDKESKLKIPSVYTIVYWGFDQGTINFIK